MKHLCVSLVYAITLTFIFFQLIKIIILRAKFGLKLYTIDNLMHQIVTGDHFKNYQFKTRGYSQFVLKFLMCVCYAVTVTFAYRFGDLF